MTAHPWLTMRHSFLCPVALFALAGVAAQTPSPQFTAFSVRQVLGPGNPTLHAAFMVEAGAPKRVLIRAVGPALSSLGVPNVLSDPLLTIYDRTGTRVLENDNWGGDAGVGAAIAAAGAIPLAPTSRDAALFVTLNPGTYLIRVSGAGGATGDVLLDLYDSDPQIFRIPYFVARGVVGPVSSSNLIIGFSLTGAPNGNSVITRGLGPALAARGIVGALPDPYASVVNTSTNVGLTTSDNWLNGTFSEQRIAQAGLMPLQAGSADAMTDYPINPGSYTLTVRTNGATGGVALGEVAFTSGRAASIIPALLLPPAEISAILGSTLTLPALAIGKPTPTYQWRKNGGNISGATNPALTLTNLQAADSANYSVVLSNTAGTTVSANYVVILPAPPQFTAQPASQTVTPGTPVVFTAAAIGSPAPTYQWFYNGGAIAGATGASLTVGAGQATGAGIYVVSASNSFGTTMSGAASLLFLTPPVILSSPARQTAAVGSTVSFSVSASGFGSLSYQWLFNGAPIAGASAPTLVLTGIQPAQSGSYAARVSNAYGSVTSAEATLTAVAAPAITTAPASQTVAQGSAATFSVIAAGTPPLTYQWTFNGSSIPGATAAAFTIPVALPSHAGNYAVVVGNTFGATVTSIAAALTVSAPVGIATAPQPRTIAQGASAQFSVVAAGLPPFSYQWTLDGVPIAGATAPALSIANAQPSAAGLYAVVVSNAHGSVTSAGAALVILTPPSIGGQPADLAVLVGGSAVLGIAAGGSGPLAYQWLRGGLPLPGATAATLSFPTARFEDAGAYACTVSNAQGGVTSAAATLSVLPTARLINASLLSAIASSGAELVLGFVIGGAGTSGPMPVALRAAGPSLAALGVPGTLDDPRLELFAGPVRTAENDNWGGDASLAGAFGNLGAFAFSGPTSRDAAVLANIATSDNSARVSAAGGATGAVITEIYDATPPESYAVTSRRLVNISALKEIGGGFTLGFVIGGEGARRLLIRAVGPGLAPLGVGGTTADPRITLFRGVTRIDENDDWSGDASVAVAAVQVGAFALPPGSKDAALLTLLSAGNYSVKVDGAGGNGIVLVEIYEAP